jgi:hypothetical protein
MNILESIDNVFADLFPDASTWHSWRTFLASLFAIPFENDEQLKLYRECTGRSEPPTQPAKEGWLIVGRKGGKSRILALIATFLAAFVDWSKFLSAGERGVIMVVAQDRDAAAWIMQYISAFFHSTRMLKQLITRETTERIELSTRISIRVHTCTIKAVRGPTVLACICDEIAFWPREDQANPGEEVIASAKPAMATIGGGLLLCASSPYARQGVLFQAYQRHYGKVSPVLIWRAATRVMNPTIDQSVISSAMEADPARYSAEYMAEFRGDVESYVSFDVIQACTDWDVFERPPSPNFRYFAFTDPSGGSSDSFTLGISHKEGDHAILDVLYEIRPPFRPLDAVNELALVLKRYRITKVQGDYYAGLWPTDVFKSYGIRYERCPKFKSDLYRDLLPWLNSGRVRLLDNVRLRHQFLNLDRQTSRSGKDSIGHPRGDKYHDDLANACAGALLGAGTKPRDTITWVDGGWILNADGTHSKPGDEHRQRVRFVHVDENGNEISKAEAIQQARRRPRV